jgi:hypothetical protein
LLFKHARNASSRICGKAEWRGKFILLAEKELRLNSEGNFVAVV